MHSIHLFKLENRYGVSLINTFFNRWIGKNGPGAGRQWEIFTNTTIAVIITLVTNCWIIVQIKLLSKNTSTWYIPMLFVIRNYVTHINSKICYNSWYLFHFHRRIMSPREIDSVVFLPTAPMIPAAHQRFISVSRVILIITITQTNRLILYQRQWIHKAIAGHIWKILVNEHQRSDCFSFSSLENIVVDLSFGKNQAWARRPKQRAATFPEPAVPRRFQ